MASRRSSQNPHLVRSKFCDYGPSKTNFIPSMKLRRTRHTGALGINNLAAPHGFRAASTVAAGGIIHRMVDRMMKPDYDERFRDTLERLLPETYNLMSAQAALEVLMDHQSGVILAQSFSALMGDRLARLIRIFENSDDTATFWYLHRCEPVNVAKDVDIPRLEEFSEKLRLVRNKTFFHIDKNHVSDSRAIYTQANIIANEVIWAMEIIWRTLNRLYEERFGHPYHQGHMSLNNMREVFKRDLTDMLEKGIVKK
jgi:hypothetical protein